VREIRVVTWWHEVLNGGEIDRLLELSHPDVEVGGPRGTGRGSALLRDWVNRAGIHLTPKRFFYSDGTVVVEQEAVWPSDDHAVTASPQTVASVFRVREDHVAGVVRYEDLASALDAAGIDAAKEIEVGRR